MTIEPYVTPAGALGIRETDAGEPAPTAAAGKRLLKAAGAGPGEALLELGAGWADAETGPGLGWLRAFAREVLTAWCRAAAQGGAAAPDAVPPPAEAALADRVAHAPPIAGGEYVLGFCVRSAVLAPSAPARLAATVMQPAPPWRNVVLPATFELTPHRQTHRVRWDVDAARPGPDGPDGSPPPAPAADLQQRQRRGRRRAGRRAADRRRRPPARRPAGPRLGAPASARGRHPAGGAPRLHGLSG